MYESKLKEGQVYEISNFAIFPQSGLYRTTLHPYKIIFLLKTKLIPSNGAGISEFGLTITNIDEVCAHTHDYEYLVGEWWILCLIMLLCLCVSIKE
jgi:hypothetical protein